MAVTQGRVAVEESVSRLVERAAAGDVAEVRVLAKGRESAVVPMLKELLAQARRAADDPALVRRLRKSLAALGEYDSRRDIVRELHSSNLYSQSHAFADAAEIGGNDMIVAVAAKLTDPSPGGRPVGPTGEVETDVGIAAPRHLAVIVLSRLVTDPSAPRIDLKRIRYRDDDVERWRTWWDANKAKYAAGDLSASH